jgi:hypothetical protein
MLGLQQRRRPALTSSLLQGETSVHKSARVSIHQATYIIDLQISIKIEFLDNQGDSKSSL